MDKLYTYSYDILTDTVKEFELPVISETERTYTVRNMLGEEVRSRKADLGKLESGCNVMHLDHPDKAYYLRCLIDRQCRIMEQLIGMVRNESERLQKLHDMLEEAEKDGNSK